MGGWLRISGLIDRFTEKVGQAAAWLALAMILLGAFNAVARYGGRFIGVNLSSNLYLELQWYLFSFLFLLGGAWGLREDTHVRVDVVYARFSSRMKGWVNLIGYVFLLVPFCVFSFVATLPAVRNSWAVREGSPDPGGLPRYHLKTFILVCFALLLVQAVSEIIKSVRAIRTGDEVGDDPVEAHLHGHGGAL